MVLWIDSYDELVNLIKWRRYSLGIAGRTLDDASGLAPGYQGKVEAKMKHMSNISWPAIAGALGFKYLPCETGMVIAVDDAALPAVTKRLVGSRNRSAHRIERHKPRAAAVAAAERAWSTPLLTFIRGDGPPRAA